MRVTQTGIFTQSQFELQRRLSEFANLQAATSTGRKIENVSDDPNAATELIRLSSEQQAANQYLRNIDDGIARLSATDGALDRFDTILTSARTIAVAASNGALTTEQRQTFAADIDRLLSESISTLNQQSGGRFLFGGTRGDQIVAVTGNAPDNSINEIAIQWTGLETSIWRDIAPAEQVPVSLSPTFLKFQQNGITKDLPTLLMQLRDELRVGTSPIVPGEYLPQLDLVREQMGDARASVGGWRKRMDEVRLNWETTVFNNTDRVSKLQDWELADLMMKYKQSQMAYQTALQTTPQLLSLSLVQFIS